MTTPRVTSLKPTKKDERRISVCVDRQHMATISDRSLSRLVDEVGLAVDATWTPELEEAVILAAGVDKAMKQSLNRLGRRAMSRRQLDDKLKQLEHPALVREVVLDRLTDLGLLDDTAYAAALVRSVSRGRPAGPRLLQQKLRQKGVDQKTAEAAITEHAPDQATQREQAAKLAETRLRTMKRLEPDARRRRLYGLLARRGFEGDVIQDVMEQLADAIQHQDDADQDDTQEAWE